MLNLSPKGLGDRVAQWLGELRQLKDAFSTSQHVYGDLVGIDLDDSSILYALLQNPLGGTRVAKAGVLGLPAGAIVDDSIVDELPIIEAAKKIADAIHSQQCRSVIAMPGSKVVIKQIKLESKLSDEKAELRAWQEAKKTFPEIVKNLYLDFSQFEEVDAEKNKTHHMVIVVGRKEDILPRVETLQKANITTKIVDVDYYALLRVFPVITSAIPNSQTSKFTALIDFNPHSIELLVFNKKKPIYYTRQNYSGDALIPIVQHTMNVEVTASAKPKTAILPTLRLTPMQSPLSQESIKTTETPEYTLTEEQKSHVVMSIRRIFQSFYGEHSGKIIDLMIITGRCALIPGLVDVIGKMLGITAVVGDPLKSIKMGDVENEAQIKKIGPAFALSIGLAMRGVPLWI